MRRRYLLFATQGYAFEILRPLQKEARARGDEVRWYLENVAASNLRPDEQQLRDVHELKAFDPEAVFVPGNWVPPFFPGIKVQVFHGFGIEKKGHFRVRGWFDLYCTHGPLTTERFEAMAARDGSFAVRETGWPKVDALFDSEADPHARGQFGDPQKPLVLYAPTFSKSLTSAPDLADEIFRLAEQGPWNWLVKFHPKMDPAWIETFEQRQGPRLQVASDPAISPLLHAADVMLTDTSSVAAEFLLLDKPVVSYRNLQPGPHLLDFRNPEQLEQQLRKAMHENTAHREAMRRFVDAMHPYRDNRSSARVLDAANRFVDEGARRKLKRKPLNLWRRLRARLKSGYFGF